MIRNNGSPYVNCEEYLAQGDIFCLKLVAPYAEDEVRIFRTTSGFHGEYVFESTGQQGKVFSYEDLELALQDILPEKRLLPFERTIEGLAEMVVVYADLLEYFVVASQTCDVSGVDSPPKSFATVLPVVPLGGFLSKQRLPIGLEQQESEDVAKHITIADYLEAKIGVDLSQCKSDLFSLPDKIREIVKDWNPQEQKDREAKNKIKNVIRDLLDNKKFYIYYLPCETKLTVPEGYIDFLRIFTVHIETLQELMPYRVATLNVPYREQFAKKLADYLGRIATPVTLAPQKSELGSGQSL